MLIILNEWLRTSVQSCVPEGIHLQKSADLVHLHFNKFDYTTGPKEVAYQPIIANQERWLVDGTKFQIS